MLYVGPYTGEIGYELLYWIPSICKKFAGKEITAISRGGTDSWYPCPVLNAFDVVDQDYYRASYLARKATTQEFKQLWKDDKLDQVIMERLGIAETVYHPSAMYHRLGHSIGSAWTFNPIKKPERYPGLPEKYVAVRIYSNDMLKKSVDAFQSSDLPHVLLVPRVPIDNHPEIDVRGSHHLVEYDAKDSLDVVTRVVAHAEKFICTHGGLSYIGPLVGTETIALTQINEENKHTPAEKRLGPLFKKEIV